jgi:hypothetical protein
MYHLILITILSNEKNKFIKYTNFLTDLNLETKYKKEYRNRFYWFFLKSNYNIKKLSF